MKFLLKRGYGVFERFGGLPALLTRNLVERVESCLSRFSTECDIPASSVGMRDPALLDQLHRVAATELRALGKFIERGGMQADDA